MYEDKPEYTVDANVKFWMIVGDGNNPRVRHYTHKTAIEEANRLALAYPGIEFFILEAIESFSVKPGVTRKKL